MFNFRRTVILSYEFLSHKHRITSKYIDLKIKLIGLFEKKKDFKVNPKYLKTAFTVLCPGTVFMLRGSSIP